MWMGMDPKDRTHEGLAWTIWDPGGTPDGSQSRDYCFDQTTALISFLSYILHTKYSGYIKVCTDCLYVFETWHTGCTPKVLHSRNGDLWEKVFELRGSLEAEGWEVDLHVMTAMS